MVRSALDYLSPKMRASVERTLLGFLLRELDNTTSRFGAVTLPSRVTRSDSVRDVLDALMLAWDEDSLERDVRAATNGVRLDARDPRRPTVEERVSAVSAAWVEACLRGRASEFFYRSGDRVAFDSRRLRDLVGGRQRTRSRVRRLTGAAFAARTSPSACDVLADRDAFAAAVTAVVAMRESFARAGDLSSLAECDYQLRRVTDDALTREDVAILHRTSASAMAKRRTSIAEAMRSRLPTSRRPVAVDRLA